MPEQLTEDSIKMGYLLPMNNLNKKPSEVEKYFALKIEDSNGDNEEWILLTEKEILSRRTISIYEMTEDWKPGRMYSFSIGKISYVACNVVFCSDMSSEKRKHSKGEKKVLLFSKSLLNVARKRAKSNPEDIPSQSKLSDFLD